MYTGVATFIDMMVGIGAGNDDTTFFNLHCHDLAGQGTHNAQTCTHTRSCTRDVAFILLMRATVSLSCLQVGLVGGHISDLGDVMRDWFGNAGKNSGSRVIQGMSVWRPVSCFLRTHFRGGVCAPRRSEFGHIGNLKVSYGNSVAQLICFIHCSVLQVSCDIFQFQHSTPK